MAEKLLKDLFKESYAKNYTKLTNGKYLVRRNNIYYTRCNTEEEAKQIVELLKKYDWDKTKIPQIKEDLGIIKTYKTNTTGFYKVSIYNNVNTKQGYTYAYTETKNKKIKRIRNVSLKKLKHKVKEQGYLWKPLSEDAKIIDKYL